MIQLAGSIFLAVTKHLSECMKAGVERFVPYDLRRTVATKTRADLGKEAAKALLGHVQESTTQIYLL